MNLYRPVVRRKKVRGDHYDITVGTLILKHEYKGCRSSRNESLDVGDVHLHRSNRAI